MDYQWDFSVVNDNIDVFLKGLGISFALTFIVIFIGTLLGFFLGIFLSTKDEDDSGFKKILTVLIDAVRALPILIFILVINYWAPPVIGIHSPFLLSCLALSLNLTAFVSDVVRSAIESVPKPYALAGFALGMTPKSVSRRIIIPEAIRQVIPTFSLLYIDVFKMSSIASVIAVKELTYSATLISSNSFRFLEVFTFLAIIYLSIILPFSYGARRLEKSKWFTRRS